MQTERGAEAFKPFAAPRRRAPRPKEEYVTALKKVCRFGAERQGHMCKARLRTFSVRHLTGRLPPSALQGNYMLKYGRRGQPHKAHFVLSEDLKSLSWTSKRARGGCDRKEIRLADVYAIEAGQGTDVFKRFPSHEHLKKLSFSLLYYKRYIACVLVPTLPLLIRLVWRQRVRGTCIRCGPDMQPCLAPTGARNGRWT